MSKDLKNYTGKDRIVTSYDYYKAVETLPIEKRYSFGIKSIDAVTEGFTHGDLIIVSGLTGHGKTSACQSISYNLSQQNVKALWFSYELSARQFFNKYKDGKIPLFYMPRKNKPYDLDWIEERIIEGIEKHDIKIVFIDHLNYIVSMLSENHSNSDMIGHTMRALKSMAVQYEIVIFLMAHTKQPKDTITPGLESLKGSSFIGQESDAVYIMHRPTKRGRRNEFEDYGTFTICKQRHTGVIGKSIKLKMYNKMFYDQVSLDDERAL